MPAGLDERVPGPVPLFAAVSVNRFSMKIAVTFRAPLIVTVHVAPDTESQPVQPVKFESVPPAAVSVTCEPLTNDAEQVGAHAMPVGFDVTVPVPSPWPMTDRFCSVTPLTV